jgi:hypothetical protein
MCWWSASRDLTVTSRVAPEHQGPEVDGVTALVGRDGRPAAHVAVGDIVAATVVSSVGPDLVATTGAAA